MLWELRPSPCAAPHDQDPHLQIRFAHEVPKRVSVSARTRRLAVPSMNDDDTTGKTGRVSIPIPANGAGEIILDIRGGSEAFTAYPQGGEALAKNAHAVVVEQTGPRTVLVTGY